MLTFHGFDTSLDRVLFHPHFKERYLSKVQDGHACIAQLVHPDETVELGLIYFNFTQPESKGERPICYHRMFEPHKVEEFRLRGFAKHLPTKSELSVAREAIEDFYEPENEHQVRYSGALLEIKGEMLMMRDPRLDIEVRVFPRKSPQSEGNR